MMPTFFSEPYYRGGMPLPATDIHTHLNNQTIEEIKLKYYEQKATKEEEEVLKEYVLYYIAAPCFLLAYETKEQEEKFKALPLDDLLDVLLDAGMDPL